MSQRRIRGFDGSSSESGEGEATICKARRKTKRAKASLVQTTMAMDELIQSHESLVSGDGGRKTEAVNPIWEVARVENIVIIM